MRNSSDPSGVVVGLSVTVGVIILIGLITLGMWGCPTYNVWQKELAGKAKLREAEWSRQIRIEEAEASMESAKHLAEAEIIRSRGVAEANKIIGESLRDNDAYLRYLWIQGLHDGTSETIYIPTEAQLPILEATRGLK
jgi:regulator of protease activity HflC (stomatin/prohibitin superfamily)